MKISIIGSGVTGQATGFGFCHQGYKTIFYDIDHKKLDDLEDKGYSVSRTVEDAVEKSDIIFICVPTPTTNRRIDLGIISNVARNIAEALKKTEGYKIVVVKSTVLPSITRTAVLPILEKYSGKKAGPDFGLCTNPEFLTEKNALQDFIQPNRTIIGEFDKKSGDMLETLYKPFDAPIIRTSLENAEMIKYVSNIFLATKISFFNEIYLICNKLGLDSDVVSSGAAYDPRIGKYGTKGGKPFGGSCFPKDLGAFLGYLEDNKIEAGILKEVQEINNKMTEKDKINIP